MIHICTWCILDTALAWDTETNSASALICFLAKIKALAWTKQQKDSCWWFDMLMQLPYLLIWCSPVHHPILLWQGKGVQFQVNPTPPFFCRWESGLLCASLVKQLPFLCLSHFEALIVDRFWPRFLSSSDVLSQFFQPLMLAAEELNLVMN